MVTRPIWRGHLRLALVSCPVALYTARHDRATIRFNMLNPETGSRIKMVSQDAETGEPISRADTVKGYEYKKGHYLVVTEEDFDTIRVESSATLNVEKFVDATSIDPIYFDTSYYLVPDGKAGIDVYAVLREAIQKTGRYALARVVISQRERTIAIRPMADGLVAQTLNEDRDLNGYAELFQDAARIKTDPEMVALAVQLIERQSGLYDPSDVEDRYESRLRAMLDAKINGLPVEHQRDEPPAGNIIDLMAALKRSIGAPIPVDDKPAPKKAAKNSKVTAEETRRQPELKLPIAGGKGVAVAKAGETVERVEKAPSRRRRA